MARTLYFDVNHHNKKDGLVLGHKYDHKDTIIHFKGFYAADPSNTIYFKLQTDNGNWMIPLADYEWLVTQPMTLHVGEFRGQLEERAADNSLVHNSDTFKVTVLKSIQEGEEYEVIDPTLDLWAVQLSNLYNELVTARDAGEFDGADGAPGEDGFSPTVSITNITGGKRITIVDKNGSHSADIMNGIDGQPGEDGEDGISPTVSISKTGKVTTISITDADGTHTATVNDGNDGSDASVTVQNIVAALGYTPADAQGLANTDEHIAEDIEPAISSMSMEIGNLTTTVNGKEDKKGEWVMKGTISGNADDRGNIDSGVDVDLSGCSELMIYGYADGTGVSNITTNITHIMYRPIANGYRKFVGMWADNEVLGLIPKFGRYSTSDTEYIITNADAIAWDNGFLVSDITRFKINTPSNVTSCDIQIYAR